MLGIFGIAVSIFLLTTVAFLTDSVSNSFTDFLTTDAGGQDINLSPRYYSEQANISQFFEYQEVINKIQTNITEVEHFIPRMSQRVRVNNTYVGQQVYIPEQTQSNDNTTTSNIESTYAGWTTLNALDIKLEESIKFGMFYNLASGLSLANGLPVNSCIITTEFAQNFNISVGNILQVYVSEIKKTINLTVLSTYEHSLKFPLYDYTNIVVDLAWWGNTLNLAKKQSNQFDWNGKASEMILRLRNRELVYDIRDIEGSESYVSGIGARILENLGLEKWDLEYPILENLGYSEFLTVGTQIIFIMISFIAMLISGILINGILTTSVEERIREYGINRVLGARKIYNLKLIVIQGILISVFGTSLGILLASLVAKFAILPFINSLIPAGYLTNPVVFVAQPTSVLSSYAIGIGVSMFVSIFPALKVMKMRIVESINPYRHEEEVFKLERDSGGNAKLIIFGSLLAANGLFIYLIVPQVILSFEIGLIIGMMLATMLIFLVGVSLLAVGLIPLLIRFFLFVFKPLARKLDNIIRITIFRYQRRNMSTSILFVLSFSFIMFTTSIVEIQQNQIGGLIQFNQGSDIVVFPTSYTIQAPTIAFQKQLMEIEGIERSSALLASTHDLEQIYSEDAKSFSVQLGDYINFKSYDVHLYGIDKAYKDVVYSQEYMTFTEGKRDEAFAKVFMENETNIIISTALSNELGLRVGDITRLTFNRGDESEIAIATIVGVASQMPGLPRFKMNSYQASQGGVIIADFHYIEYFNIPGGDNAYIDRVFVKVMDNHSPAQIKQQIDNKFKDSYDVYVQDTKARIGDSEESFAIIKYVLTGILIGTVLIGLFGLISSSYSSVLERRREIAIIRTLGLYPSEVSRMFQLESLILLLASGGSGGIIGFLLAYLLTQNMVLFTESPSIFAIPWDIVGIIIGTSVIFLLLGMRGFLARLRKKNLIEIYRETL
jgi:ABC-type antimicrobial peptide transport system permease subunit